MSKSDAGYNAADGITINGTWRAFNGIDMNTPLLWFLREQCGLIGTKYGCGIAYCGACTVLLENSDSDDGRYRAIRSCVTPLSALPLLGAAQQSPNKPPLGVVTIEGLASCHPQPLPTTQNTSPCGASVQPSAQDSNSDCLHPVQAAWIELQVPQCGYCQSGQILSAVALLETLAASNKALNKALVDQSMAGNLCRCGTYPRIRKAIRKAAESMQIEVST